MNFSRFHLLVIFIAVLALTGCGGGKKLSDYELNRQEFTKALASDYSDYSKLQQLRLDLTDTEHFDQKALLAAEGVQIDPDQPALRDIADPAKLDELNKARRVLLDSVNSNTIQSDPRASARAYFLFDCWVEAEEEKWKVENLEACRNEFFDVVNYLSVLPDKGKGKKSDKKVAAVKSAEDQNVSTEQAMYEQEIAESEKQDEPADGAEVTVSGAEIKPEDIKVTTVKKPEEVRPVEANASKAGAPVPTTTPVPAPSQNSLAPQAEAPQPIASIPASKAADKTIYFDSDSVAINEAEMKSIDEVVAQAKGKPGYTIVVNGHTDRAEKGDIDLSIKRAKSIGTELIKKGIAGEKIQYYGYGGTDPEKATKAGMKEQLNRRVEIFIQ